MHKEKDIKRILIPSAHTVLIVITLWMSQTVTWAQTTEANTYHQLDEAVQTAIANNPTLKAADLQIEQQRALQNSSWDIPKTEVSWTHGQYNSIQSDDNQFNVSQRIEFPSVYAHQNKLAKAQVEGREQMRIATQNELIQQVKSNWYALWLAMSKAELLHQQDSIYQRYVHAATLRYETGESNLLEKATAESQVAEIHVMIDQNQSDISILQTQLRTLLNIQDATIQPLGKLERRANKITPESSDITQNPTLAWFKQQMQIAAREKSVQKAQLLPDITLGYFNQSLIGTGRTLQGGQTNYTASDRFDGFSVGLAIPIFSSKSQIAQVKAAEMKQQTTAAQLEAQTHALQGQLEALLQQYQKYRASLDYYGQNALPQSDLILAQAQKGFESGSIGYIEYIQGLNTALNIKFNYLETLNLFNQTLIQIEWISGVQ
ncbi:Outer membrane protein TolC [Reichenbachiella agariperforans]|uniref:Outer membrane protein TolC n=1 Tax=Reichenbachiella agariperforans TaxID=156994 RepID=A0A1M6JIS2_REIAG|nr:Outer membrane protein TolC [Reichenbachiella agariperforans]